MSIEKFTDSYRECVWKAHQQKCFYCRTPVLFADFEIDHLIPEILLSDKPQLDKFLKEYGLPSTFKIQDIANHAPSCGPCNNRKGEKLLAVGQVAILIAAIASKIGVIEKCQEQVRKHKGLESILLSIKKSVDNSVFTKTDLMEGLNTTGLIEFSGPKQLNISQHQICQMKSTLNLDLGSVPREFFFSKHASYRMLEEALGMDEIICALQGSVSVEQMSLAPSGDVRYKILTEDNAHIVFSITRDTIFIVTAWRLRSS